MTRILYTIPDAAEQVSQSVDTIRRAIKATGHEKDGPPPLRAKRDGRKYLIQHEALVAWAASLRDA
ncbi:MAG: hypothetical protein ACXVXP_05860 [Mycobacteriaceae bacterium]